VQLGYAPPAFSAASRSGADEIGATAAEPTTTGTAIADDQSARDLRPRLAELEMKMSGVNAEKFLTNQDITNYLQALPGRLDWPTLQGNSKQAAADVRKIREAVGAVNTTNIGGLNLHTALIIALTEQERAYESLANFPEPSSNQDKDEAQNIASKLAELLSKVQELERILDERTRPRNIEPTDIPGRDASR
jgi:hypothetical protein